ncbi:hypothetical protein C474_10801 [Halogeometricum pallidum JCM 14848]|uniref:DUF58 domain-containing protein n=1 Tax=Halogeometricum pallidum JCM 14848 TaxID=1227487 RepID=M0D657_HALPD|nr:DUF58 domain-containing protein [Halogeometricum pallidum]ELZ30945.1 hypothetical protein C474_10801 [Halogeometricum pallidum JCM 14848]
MTTVRRTRRWRGVVAVALFAAAVGLLAKDPVVLLLGAVGAGYAAYPWLTSPPTVDLDLTRTVDPHDAEAGTDVDVTVRVRNTGSSTLTDLRVVDGVPPMLTVSGGTPRHAAFLRPGATTEFSYAVRAEHGRHQFDPATAIARDAAGAHEVETTVQTDTAIECAATVPEVPLRQQTMRAGGSVVTDEGGAGTEFHQTREYRSGDPLSRIDWRRRAKTGELTTIEFREERLASVVLCLDARPSAYRATDEDEPHAVACGREGMAQVLTALADTRNPVGVAAVGRQPCWLPPRTGSDHLAEARRRMGSHPAFSTVPPAPDADWGADGQLEQLRRRLDPGTQVVLFSPLADEAVTAFALELERGGTAVTVVSPDPTTTATRGGRLATVERDDRIRRLRSAEVRVVDWDPAEPLGPELVRAREGFA